MTSKEQEFQDEIEHEIEKGLNNPDKNTESYTVLVKDDEYVVKRRYTDKNKARGAADDLRKTNKNVDDDTDGTFHGPDSDMDEKTDWSILVNTSNDLLIKQQTNGTKVELPAKNRLKIAFPAAVFFIIVAVTAFFMFKPDNNEIVPDKAEKKIARQIKTAGNTELPETAPKDNDKPEVVTWEENDQKKSVAVETKPVKTLVNKSVAETTDKEQQVPEKNNSLAEKETLDTGKKSEQNITKKEIQKPVLSFPFTIHLSSYKLKNSADEEVKLLMKKNFTAFATYVEIPGKGVWYRTFTGYYKKTSETKKIIASIKKSFKIDCRAMKTPYSLQIGEIDTKENLREKELFLKQKGYSPYYTPAYNGENLYRLLEGAYATEKGVVTLQEIMAKDGLTTKIVRR